MFHFHACVSEDTNSIRPFHCGAVIQEHLKMYLLPVLLIVFLRPHKVVNHCFRAHVGKI